VDDDQPLYLPDGDAFVATHRTQGGWDPNAQHGGPVQALLARAVEHTPTLVPMQVVRLTHDLIRPVPLGKKLRVSTDIVREGKRIQLVDAVLREGDAEHARLRALRLRDEDLSDVPGMHNTVDDRRTEPQWVDELEPTYLSTRAGVPGFLEGMELRRFEHPDAPEGVYGYWVRMLGPLVAGEPTTPLQLLSVVGDFGNMIGTTFDPRIVSAINPDLNVHVLRLPVGEWIAVLGDSRLGLASGVGLSSAQLRDRAGVCALTSNSQLFQRR
jgi:Thioesterase-like superfamily